MLGIDNNPKTVEGILHSLVRQVEQKIENYKQLVSNDTDYISRWKELQMYKNATTSPYSSSPGIRLFFNLDIGIIYMLEAIFETTQAILALYRSKISHRKKR